MAHLITIPFFAFKLHFVSGGNEYLPLTKLDSLRYKTRIQKIAKDYANEKSNYKRFLGVKNNKHFNALQVKFSYAITCHKSQGGQWNTIFVEQPYLPNGMDKDYIRWLYTAVTRAKEKLYLIGFKNDMFVENQ